MSDGAAISSTKAELRKAAATARASAHADVDPGPACAALIEAVRRTTPPGGGVSAYLAIRTEIDPAPVFAPLVAAGFSLCLPVPFKNAALQFRPWHPGDALVPGGFGTLIPEDPSEVVPVTLIVPLLAFDAQGYRLGYGGGHYDRTLEGLRRTGTVSALGFAYAAQQLERVPTEPTDQPLDAVVTELGARWRRPPSLATAPTSA